MMFWFSESGAPRRSAALRLGLSSVHLNPAKGAHHNIMDVSFELLKRFSSKISELIFSQIFRLCNPCIHLGDNGLEKSISDTIAIDKTYL